jgi:putative methionine-R-sulfoxide reductase with GAF domain
MNKVFKIILAVLVVGIAGLWIYLLYQEFQLLPVQNENMKFVLFQIKALLFALYAIAAITLMMFFSLFSSRQKPQPVSKEQVSPALDQFSVEGSENASVDVMLNLQSIRQLLSSKMDIIDNIWENYNKTDDPGGKTDSIGEEELMRVLSTQIQLLGTANFPDLLNSLVENASQIIGAKRVSLFLYNPAKKNLKMVKGIGFESDETIETNADEGFAGYAFKSGKRIFVTNIETHPQLGRKNKPQYNSKSFIIFPIRLFLQDNCIGVLNLTEKQGENGIFNMVDLEKMNILVNNFRLKMENMILLREFNKVHPGETPTP